METPPEGVGRGDVRPAQEDLRVTLAARQEAAGPEAPISPPAQPGSQPGPTVAGQGWSRNRAIGAGVVVALGCALALLLGAFGSHASHRRSRGSAVPSSRSTKPVLRITFAHGKTLSRVPYGQAVRITGVANNARGAAITINQTPLGGRPISLGNVAANDEGKFEFTIPPGGIRSVIATAGSGASNRLEIEQAARVVLAARHHVRTVRLFRLAGRVYNLAEPGVAVKLQVRRPGRLYQTVLTVRTRASGSFRGHVSLRLRDARYRLRALVPAQRGFQFARSTSNVILIRTH